MPRSSSSAATDKKTLLLVLLILVNIALVIFGFYFLYHNFASGSENMGAKKDMAKSLVEYNRRLAKNLEVDSRALVHEALSRFNYEIELAASGDEINRAILVHGSRTQEIILQEYQTKQREKVLSLVNQDENVKAVTGYEKLKLTVRLLQEEGVKVEPDGFLTPQTVENISETIIPGELMQDLDVEIEVENGHGQLMQPVNLMEQIRTLTKEIDTLRVSLHDLRVKAGFGEMTGPGIIVRIYDAENGYTSDTIIHDTDVRDMVNELFAAGASGVAVGKQRLTATSAIRCVGPSILVNDERISVNPVVITAIGDHEVLESGLDIMRITLEISRQVTIEIDRVENLTLPAFIPR